MSYTLQDYLEDSEDEYPPTGESIPIARVEIDLPFGEPALWDELSPEQKEAIRKWQQEVKEWREKINAKR